MSEIAKYNCQDATEARIREQYWIDELQAKLNMCKAFVTEKKKNITKYIVKNIKKKYQQRE